jgi:hypothetical protein
MDKLDILITLDFDKYMENNLLLGVKLLLSLVNVNVYLMYVNEKISPNLVNIFLDDPDCIPTDHTFRWAAMYGHENILMRLLQDPRIDPADSENEAIQIAASEGQLAIVKRLLQDPRVDPSDLENKALIQAAQNGHEEVVNLLLKDPRVKASFLNVDWR